MRWQLNRFGARAGLLAAACLLPAPASAAVLAEDRADAMYHYYDGGGTEVNGPALLVRKGIGEQVSVYGSYYADSVSGASIDVVTTASPYKEKREELGVGVDFLRRNTTLSVSYSTSDERDYLSNSLGIEIAHEVFDGLSTVTFGYQVGRDEVGKVGTSFREDVNRYHYKLGWSQIFTRSFLMSLEYEGILEAGFLSSPYRAARLQGLLVPEIYPGTRDSYSVALRGIKGLGSDDGRLGSALHVGYRYFWDTWDVTAHTLDVSYRRHVGERWTLEPRYRYYKQSAASFYSDNFDANMNYMARDKELSTFDSHSLGIKAAYRVLEQRYGMRTATVNAAYDHVRFAYDDFTDMRNGQTYDFDARVVQLFFSAWY
jgi:hypothetical protein